MSTFKDTIEITDGIHAATNRRVLKTTLERFGEIDICHKIGDPREDPVWVRYRYSSSAEKALEEINKGTVFLGGVPLKAQWKTRSKEPPGRLDLAHGIMKEGHTSRDLYSAGRGGSSQQGRDSDRRSRRSRSRRDDRRDGGGRRGDRGGHDDRRGGHDDRRGSHDDRRKRDSPSQDRGGGSRNSGVL
eukprot:TRINITY_DN7139_c0_g1_i1.p1 TRINITY_DN7139_c0_g1~~TRINITY_DN7139_c0_g1_i1.p1  ORF type:complete len:187 (+),score=26.26 TRINITY_DN7139_c0_g1_i1:185-745(+)